MTIKMDAGLEREYGKEITDLVSNLPSGPYPHSNLYRSTSDLTGYFSIAGRVTENKVRIAQERLRELSEYYSMVSDFKQNRLGRETYDPSQKLEVMVEVFMRFTEALRSLNEYASTSYKYLQVTYNLELPNWGVKKEKKWYMGSGGANILSEPEPTLSHISALRDFLWMNRDNNIEVKHIGGGHITINPLSLTAEVHGSSEKFGGPIGNPVEDVGLLFKELHPIYKVVSKGQGVKYF